ncbi:SRPBCC family protein [Goodfellowiella coeruleoviolacea]|uniref:Polyketide cyclase / dehydrase and lipid transport n=1 Tax=Goodfellowiella coeruleoviolacea TaxID=334858 RepID=A0AAE3G963_9PSEU|nr:SRPBCC family protein [Goodfellowiella coeruleoviolacea]MCP2163563.1 Polyketide cyclase / dehydrase and lipid transport [Goodfellowiella coeruleoviolacea]
MSMTDPATAVNLADLRIRRQTWVAADPNRVYGLISDVRAMSALSPAVLAAHYDEGHGPRVGAWFTGHNTHDGHEWRTRSQVTEATPGVAFAWQVDSAGTSVVSWRYAFRPEGAGTVVEESWELLALLPVFGSTRADLLALRARTVASIEATLVALASTVATASATH